jgi:hypothetical protein
VSDEAPTPAGEQTAPPDPAPDPAAVSAASDPLPGSKKKGRPLGSKNKRPRTPAQIAAQRANLDKGRAAMASRAAVRTGPTDAQLRDAVAGLYGATGMGVAFLDQELGQTVASCAESAAEAWVKMGQQSPAVRRGRVSLTTTGAAGELLAAHMPLVALAMARVRARQVTVTAGPEPVPPTNGADPGVPPWSPYTNVPMS